MALIVTAQQQPPSAPTTAGRSEPLRCLRWAALGTNCEVQYVCAEAAAAQAFEAAVIAWVAAFEAKYSRFRPDSIVSRINAAAGGAAVAIDAEMEQFLDVCHSLHFMTKGLLDVTALPLMRLWDYKAAVPRIPSLAELAAARRLVGWPRVERSPGRVRLPEAGMALDFGGWGKEYAVDVVAGIARKHGITQALVDFGHDIHAVGSAPGKPGWHIGLEDPARPGSACWGSVALANRSVASSGDYIRGFTINGVRYGHIVDPRTGFPVAHGARQVTVLAPTCLQAGALSTTAFIMNPEEGIRFIQESMGAEGCILTANARHQTRGFFNYVVKN
jgi:thiamine biosynthesis lipoprotein